MSFGCTAYSLTVTLSTVPWKFSPAVVYKNNLPPFVLFVTANVCVPEELIDTSGVKTEAPVPDNTLKHHLQFYLQLKLFRKRYQYPSY